MWRLVFSNKGFDYNTVFHCMTYDEIEEANAALDIYIKEERKQQKRKR